MWVEQGTREDWLLLSDLHYKMNSEPFAAKYWRLRLRGETIGVCVFGMSRPLLKERHALFPLLRPGDDTQISNIHRYAYINDNFRVIGRFVLDTMYRSAGVAYRFANLASRMYGFNYMEIQSSMSKYNMFAQRAGFSMVKPIRSAHYEPGLKFMRKYFSAHPADQEALMEEFATMPEQLQQSVKIKLREFYFKHSPLEKTGGRRFYAKSAVGNWDVRRIITKIQGLCFASPLYGFYHNPDAFRPDKKPRLPDTLPLLAFNLQDSTEPLNLDKLDFVKGWLNLKKQIYINNWQQPTKISIINT